MTKKSTHQQINKLSNYPIIQAPMAGGVISPNFVSQISNFGMLGSIPSGYLSLEQLENFIIEVKAKTPNPFQVNIFVDYQQHHQPNIQKPKELIEIEKKLGIYNSDFFDIPSVTKVNEILELILKHKIKIISTTFGRLQQQDIQKLKNNDVFIMNTVNCVKEAEIAIFEQKTDSVIFQSIEAGGHKGGFLDGPYSDSTSIIKLKEQCPDVFFVKSGGIVNKTDIQEALSQGYDSVQIGTGFLMTVESMATELYKNILLEVKNSDQTIITDSITGKKARGVRNKLSTLKIENKLPYPLLHYATKNIRDFAKQRGAREYQSFWAGTSAAKIESVPSLQDYMVSLI